MKCILICLLILVCGFFASDILALKCVTPDGLQIDEVRRVIKKCMRKVGAGESEAELQNYDEYENFEEPEPARRAEGEAQSRGNDRMNNRNYNNRPRLGHDYDYPRTGGNYRQMNRRRNDSHDPSQYSNPPYQYAPSSSSSSYGDNNSQRGSVHYGRGQNKSNNDNSSAGEVDKHERDRSCILQCFFEELKMANDQGFPDRNRMIGVLTKQLRDRELRDFYVDSIQECHRMVGLEEPKVQRDNCLHAQTLIICLSERAKMNCVDWNAETVLF